MKNILTRGLLLSVALAGLLRPASAQLTLALTPNPASVTAGTTLSLLATLTNGAGEVINLSGTSGNITGPSSLLTLDDTAFLSGLPLFLAPGGSYSASLSVLADSAATLGSYTLDYQVDGDGISTTPYPAASSSQITVTGATTSSASEPSVLALVSLALLIVPWRRHNVDEF